MGMVLCLRRVEDAAVLRAKASGGTDAFVAFLYEPEAEEDIVDFDKAWQVLHFLLTQTAYEGEPPLSFLLHAGVLVGPDFGYGPARLAEPCEVRAFRDALAGLDDATLRARYDLSAIVANDIYLAETLADEGEEGWEYVVQSLPALRALLDRSVETDASIAIWIG
jgi:hypothetical protein